MTAQLPTYLTTDGVSRAANVHRSVIARLLSQGEITPAGYVEECEKRQPIFDPMVAVIIAGLVARKQHTDIPPAIAGQ